MKIFIHLKNTTTDLKAIKEALRHFDGSVVVEEDHVVVATSSIISGDIDLLTTDNIWETWFRITEFLDIINGAAKIEGVMLNNISLLKVHYEDTDGKQHILGSAGKIEAVLPGIRCGDPDISKIIPLALKDRAVAKALRLCSRDLDWVNLYRIYEVIKEDMGDLSSDELKILKSMANNSSVSGDYARHGKIISGTPKKTMHLTDAQHLIKRTLREWIYNKINSGPRNI